MRDYRNFYIDGQWVAPVEPKTADVINPATEAVAGTISLGSVADVNKAVAAARKAFASWSQTTREQRLDLLLAIQAEYARRQTELGDAIIEEMGAPSSLAHGFHVGLGAGHLQTAIEVLREFKFDEPHGATMIAREPIGVCDQRAKALRAAATALFTSATPPSEIVPATASVAGVMPSAVFGSTGATHWPSI